MPNRYILYLLGILIAFVVGYFLYSKVNLVNKIALPTYVGPIPDGALVRLGKGEISVFALSPDGNYLAVGNQIGIYLYNAKTFEQLWVNPCGNIRILEFNPDSQLLISISDKNTTYQRSTIEWEVETGNILKTFDFFTEFNLYDISWKTDRNPLIAIERHQIVGKSKEGIYLSQWSIHFIDIETARSWQAFTIQSVVDSFVFNPDDNTIAYSITNEGIKIWDIENGKEVTNISLPTYAKLAFSPDGKFLLASTPWSIYAFDPLTGSTLGRIEHSPPAMNLSINQDGNMFAGVFDKKVMIWNLPDMVEIQSWTVDSGVSNIIWDKSSTLFIQNGDNRIAVWDVSREKILRTLDGYLDITGNLIWSPDSKMIAATTYSYGGRDSVLLFWDLNGNLLHRIEYSQVIRAIAWSPDNKKIAVSNNGQLIFLDTENFTVIKMVDVADVTDLDWSPDGKQIAVALSDRKISVLDYSTGATLFSMTTLPKWMPSPEFPNNPVINVAWSPDGNYIAAGMWSGPAYIWNSSNGKQLAELDHIYTGYSYMNSVVDISWSPDGRYLAGCFNSGIQPRANEDGTTYFVPGEAVILWNVETGKQDKTLKANYELTYSIDWSTNNDLLAVSLYNHNSSNLYLWNTNDTSLSLAAELPELKISGSAYKVAWAPNGKMLAALQSDGTIVVWVF